MFKFSISTVGCKEESFFSSHDDCLQAKLQIQSVFRPLIEMWTPGLTLNFSNPIFMTMLAKLRREGAKSTKKILQIVRKYCEHFVSEIFFQAGLTLRLRLKKMSLPDPDIDKKTWLQFSSFSLIFFKQLCTFFCQGYQCDFMSFGEHQPSGESGRTLEQMKA